MPRIGRPSAAATRGLSTPIRYDSRGAVHNAGPDRAIDRPCLPFRCGRSLKWIFGRTCMPSSALVISRHAHLAILGAPTVDRARAERNTGPHRRDRLPASDRAAAARTPVVGAGVARCRCCSGGDPLRVGDVAGEWAAGGRWPCGGACDRGCQKAGRAGRDHRRCRHRAAGGAAGADGRHAPWLRGDRSFAARRRTRGPCCP